jgi:hypothetical protein
MRREDQSECLVTIRFWPLPEYRGGEILLTKYVLYVGHAVTDRDQRVEERVAEYRARSDTRAIVSGGNIKLPRLSCSVWRFDRVPTRRPVCNRRPRGAEGTRHQGRQLREVVSSDNDESLPSILIAYSTI